MRIVPAGAIVVVAVLALFLAHPLPVANLEEKVFDWLSARAGTGISSGRVAIVEIDEKSLSRFGRWPWDRGLVGDLSTRILNAGASVVALDMMFPQQAGEQDARLAAALSGKPTLVGYAFQFDSTAAGNSGCPVAPLPLAMSAPADSKRPAVFRATSALCSVPAIAHAAAATGFLNAAPDRDGVLRRVPLVIAAGDAYYASLALASLRLYQHSSAIELDTGGAGAYRLRLDGRPVDVEAQTLLRLRFRGAGRSFPYVSAADVLDAAPQAHELAGKIVLVGASALGMEIPILTAVDPRFPDVEVQATAVDNLLQGDALHRPAGALFWELALALMAGALSLFLLGRPIAVWIAAMLGLTAAAWAACVWAASSGGLLFSPLPATAMLIGSAPVLAFFQYGRQRTRAERTQRRLLAVKQRSLEELRESESRYARLVENVNDAIIRDDIEGRVVFANRRFREWFGLPDTGALNVRLEQYVAPEWIAEVRERHDRRMRGEEAPGHFEFEGIRPDGSRIWIEALVTTVEEDGRITGTQGALRDATERKRIEAQYLQAQKMESVGRLAGGVAHDFNNLLTVINGYSALLIGKLPPGDPTRQGLEQILKAGEHASDLTRKLLTFSRKTMVRPQPVNLNSLILEAQNILQRMIGEDVQLTTQLSPDLDSVVADPGQIQQVLMNLLVNARDAMPRGGQLVVETRNVPGDANGPLVCLSVTDTGTGMSEEVKRHLFEPFYTTKEQGKGTGLGLATVYGIVQQSGGRIEASSAVGKGTTFRVYLPAVRSAAASTEPAVREPSLEGSQTVLVVEDQDAVRQLARTILESYGYRILEASSGPDALALAEQYPAPIHLLLTDVVLPLMSGRTLSSKLTAARPTMKVLFISGYSGEGYENDATGEGEACLLKPFTAEALAGRVRQILSETDSRRGHATGE